MDIIKPLYDNIILNCTIVSDTHIDEKHPVPQLPMDRLRSVLRDCKESSTPVDVLLTVGDTTSRGSKNNWAMTVDCFKSVPDAAKKIILTVGNHDGWNDNGYDEALDNYLKNFEIICGDKIDKPYFSYNINGCHFIFIGTDSDSGCEAELSDEQVNWFKEEMSEAGKDGRPIFVFCHQSLNQKHGLPITWDKSGEYDDLADGGIGARSSEIEEILKSQKNVFYFSGHSHMGLGGENCMKENGYASFEDDDGVTLVNLPSLSCGNHHGEIRDFCIGIQLEVYEDKVVLRPRNYGNRKFITEIPIKGGKPYWEKLY